MIALLLAAALVAAEPAAEVAQAFRQADAEKRADAVRALRAKLRDLPEKERSAAAGAVERGMREEVAAFVRIAATELLFDLRCARASDRFLLAALDPDPVVRAFVRRTVKERADERTHAAIASSLANDESWRYRATLVDLCRASGRPAAVESLLGALSDGHPAVASAAAEALECLTGGTFGTDEAKWRAHLEALRAARAPAKPDEETRTSAGEHRFEERRKPIEGVVPTLFTIPIRCKLSLFVVDMSASLRKGARSAHLVELKRALFGLPSDVSFNVLCFDQRLFFFASAKSLSPATLATKAELEKWLDTLPAGDRTDVRRSLVTGIAMLKEALDRDPSATAELFVLTDGVETVQTLTDAQVEAQFERLPAGRCRIHVVGLGQKGTPALRALAERTGGTFVEAASR